MTLPTLKTHRDIEMVLTIAPSGSDVSDAVTALSALSMSPLAVVCEGVPPFCKGVVVSFVVRRDALKGMPVPPLAEEGDSVTF